MSDDINWYYLLPPWWKFGGKLIYWAEQQRQIDDFINVYNKNAIANKINEIKPLSERQQQSFIQGVVPAPVTSTATLKVRQPAETTMPVKNPIWWHGGMRSPHLHSGDKMYKLSADQWNAFTAQAIGPIAEKLRSAKSVPFDKMMQLTELVEEVT